MPDDPELKRLLWYLLGGARGGESRARIILELSERPSNPNQLANKLNVDYRTITHHVSILLRNSLVTTQGEGYAVTYFVSPRLESNMDMFRDICKKLRFV
jgi:predicted transcriptional regulator